MERIVIALGGNALLKKGEAGFYNQLENARKTSAFLADIVDRGYEVIISHGNGRQVGAILLQSHIAKEKVPPVPLDAAVAETQGQIGYSIQQTLQNELIERGIKEEVSTVVTQVLVDPTDPAFQNPTKFVGSYYSEQEAKKLKERRGWTMKEDPRGGWRRVVPSPDPKDIVEKGVVKQLLKNNTIVITVGGGGIPVVSEEEGYKGVKAVIDKDLASELLAEEINADKLVILTDVEKVMLNFGTSNQQPIDRMTAEEAMRYYEKGHFEAGSMGPKVKAGIRFAKSGEGRRCIIAHLKNGASAVEENAGTVIYSK
ncbi:MAG: carbamate kinase [Candidatus Korarchaeota archaeon]|nr:carbamate kinase [Candidatus Korarchaeota archaeon]NIU84666.1 carbamate kinase [Candidatus Thorarchaeota archaeon]NIW14687.1 carbamate kinase [Candidatus Thorarchaeota archaeon]NIW52758.1 carbamate kinase [Candidatus Korarchaeota archaeon]